MTDGSGALTVAGMARDAWSDAENDAIVADYFAMLADDLAGRPYNKREHYRRLHSQIGRGEGSIENKHQNISAVLELHGDTWLTGLKPRRNYQASLDDAVTRWLAANAWLSRDPVQHAQSPVRVPQLAKLPSLPANLDQLLARARRFDVAGRDERNRALGRAGEEWVLACERVTLSDAGRDDLATRVRWVSQEDGDGAGFDIWSFTPDGRDRLIEVKTTNGAAWTPFHISRNELAVADAQPQSWCLLRVWNFAREPQAFELRPPLEAHVSLVPTVFQAAFKVSA